MLAAIALVCVGVIAHRAATSLAHAGIVPEPPRRHAAPQLEHAATMAAPAAAEPGDASLPHQGQSIPFDEPIPAPAAPTLAALPSTSAPSPAASPAPLSPVVPSRPPPTASELQAALTTTPIVMYTASWCGVCRKARLFLSENGLRYQDIDVDQAPDGWAKVQSLAGRRAVPVIIVDGGVMLGLDPNAIMRSVARSMERRLGISGITFKSQ